MCRIACKLLLIVTLAALPAFAQSPQGETSPKLTEANNFPDSSEGLRQMLIHVSIAARGADAASQLPALIKDMEVPDYRNWAVATYGRERGKTWAESYSKDIAPDEEALAGKFVRWAGEEGDFFVWKVGTGTNSPGGSDKTYVQGVIQPVDAFYADWRSTAHASGQDADSVGYFLYIDGKFRWDKTVHAVPPGQTKPGGYPSCSYCPPPQFPPGPVKKGLNLTVVVRLTVQPDGHGTDIQVVKSGGADFDKQAAEIVKTWIFRPALDPDGKPIPVTTNVQVTFRAF